jgi:antitoxin ParD1/3/4
MEISLTPQHEQFIQEQIRSGKYYCASEVIRDALELLEERAHLNQRYIEKLKKEVAIGLEQLDRGEGTDGEEFFKELLEEIAIEEKAK